MYTSTHFEAQKITNKSGSPKTEVLWLHEGVSSIRRLLKSKPMPTGPAAGERPEPGIIDCDAVAGKSLLIVSEVRFLREGVARIIEKESQFSVVGLCENVNHALSVVRKHPAATVLLDASFSNGLEALREIRAVCPAAQVIVFAVSETQDNVIAWAKAGAAGYIPTTIGFDEFLRFVESITRGEQICSATIVSGLMRLVASSPGDHSDLCLTMSLTVREREIVSMIAEGLSNKEIARRLKIELSTTKSHVHNLLGKLGLQGRGQIAHWALTRGSYS
ncbi:MAG TPA: response regulator transcription factor [Roseiarcus sp.]|nr:response regulator transcription factor [Roseiarcus sp.]